MNGESTSYNSGQSKLELEAWLEHRMCPLIMLTVRERNTVNEAVARACHGELLILEKQHDGSYTIETRK